MKRCIIICSLKVILFMVFFVSLTVADSDTPIENPESLKDVVVGQNGEISSLHDVVLPYIARKVQKSIVSIRTINGNEVVGFDNEGNPSFKEKIIGTTSGIIISSEGYILTFRGAIANNPQKIEVILHPEEKAIEAKVVGWDKKTDLAVLKMESLIPLLPVSLGDSDKIRIGEQILTLGYSGNVLIVTTGRISARSLNTADLPLGSINMNIIPVDTTIPSGSTGGALVNMKGEVIGVLYLRTEGGTGEGFCCAIPINSAKPVIDRLIKLGRVTGGWLGIGFFEDIKPELAKSLGLSDLNGVFVMEVFPDTPAENAGLESGDVIRSFDGKDIKSPSDLMLAVATTDVGKRVKVLIIRDKSEKEIEVEVGERPEEKKSALMRKSKTKQEVLVIGDIPVIGKIRSDAKEDESGSGYALTVEADGAYLLRFPPNSEPEVAGSIDQIFQNHTRLDIQFVPGVDQSAIQKLEEYMHDRNFSITSRIRATEEGQSITSWTLRKNPERLQIYIGRNIEERQTSERRQTGVYEVHATDLGKHIQVGELQEVDKEPTRITIFFDDEGKVLLKNFIAQNPGQKLFLQTEGVGVGEGEVPNEGDWTSLAFALSPGKLKRLEHAFEMSKLQLIRTKR